MPAKKKTTKKSRTTKKPASKNPPVKVSAVKAVAPVSEPVAGKRRLKPEVWAALAALFILASFFSLSAMVNRNNSPASDMSSQSSNDTPSDLRVITGQQGGASSNQSSGALQPQATGLQQAQPTTQSAGGLNLQAQTTPDQNIIR